MKVFKALAIVAMAALLPSAASATSWNTAPGGAGWSMWKSSFNGTTETVRSADKFQLWLAEAASRDYPRLRPVVDLLRDEPAGLGTLRAVNHAFNSILPWVSDQRQWGQDDYWADPGQLLSQGAGDCEDFAVAKFVVLLRLGWDPEGLRVVFLYDSNRHLRHAILVAQADGQWWALDDPSSSNEVRPVNSIRQYRPDYSANAMRAWSHK